MIMIEFNLKSESKSQKVQRVFSEGYVGKYIIDRHVELAVD